MIEKPPGALGLRGGVFYIDYKCHLFLFWMFVFYRADCMAGPQNAVFLNFVKASKPKQFIRLARVSNKYKESLLLFDQYMVFVTNLFEVLLGERDSIFFSVFYGSQLDVLLADCFFIKNN